MDVGTIVRRAAIRYRDSIAVEGPDGSRTFGQLGDRVARLATALRGLGLADEDRVLDLQSNACTYVETDLAISAAGLCRVALNYRLRSQDWERIAIDSGARALIVQARFLTKEVEYLASLMEHVIVIGDHSAGLDYERLIDRATSRTLPVIADDRLVSLNYSSGTTGAPKGAQRTHRNRVASLGNMVTDVLGRPAADDVWCHAGPITHASGLFVLPHLAFGVRQVILPTWDADAFLDAVLHRGVTGSVLVPTMVARLLNIPGADDIRERGELRRLCYAGAPMPTEHIVEARERITENLVQFYGLVEAIPPVTVLDAGAHALATTTRPELLASCGRPALGVGLRVVDDEGVDVPAGEIGEIVTGGDHIMRGYFRSANAVADGSEVKSVVDGWLRTGDLGRVDEEGFVYLVDRRGDMIITGGYNVFPREVEDAIACFEGVDEVAVVGLPDSEWGQRVVAFYTVRPGVQVDESRLIEHCRGTLPGFKKPRELHAVAGMPLTSTGKIDKKALKEAVKGKA
jgi:acyl-CoA synthetase (AMP-forming)/AMP-acid ligase II